MAVSTFTNLLPRVLPRVQRCDDTFALQALQSAYREFCRRSEAYRIIDTVDTVAEQESYDFSAIVPTNYTFLRATRIWIRSEDQVTDGEDGTLISPGRYDVTAAAVVKFASAPASEAITDGLRIEMALTPDSNVTTVNTTFLNRWADAFVDGALADLFSMRGREWYDPDAARSREFKFMAQIDAARREVEVEYTSREEYMRGEPWL